MYVWVCEGTNVWLPRQCCIPHSHCCCCCFLPSHLSSQIQNIVGNFCWCCCCCKNLNTSQICLTFIYKKDLNKFIMDNIKEDKKKELKRRFLFLFFCFFFSSSFNVCWKYVSSKQKKKSERRPLKSLLKYIA